MEIVENIVKCDKIIMFDHKFYLKLHSFLKILSHLGDYVKKFCPGVGFLNEKLVAPGSARGVWLSVNVIPALVLQVQDFPPSSLHLNCIANYIS